MGRQKDISPADMQRSAGAQDANISRRRKSLPGRSSSVPRVPPLNNQPPMPTTSPELISSLISSLSTISTPAQSHFDSLPFIGSQTVPSSPNFFQSEFPRPSRISEQGFGMDYGAYKEPTESTDSPFLHPDDAAISPVVRMAPAPAPASPRSPRSPKLKSSFGRDGSPFRPASKSSHTSSRAAFDDYSLSGFGIVSSEPVNRSSRAPSVASSSSGGRRSLKGPLGLLRRGSRESTREKDFDRGTRPPSYEDNLKTKVTRSRASLKSRHSMADLVEEGGQVKHIRNDITPAFSPAATQPPSPASHQILAASLHSPGGIGSGRVIPTRESSLRHSYNKKQRSARPAETAHTNGRESTNAAKAAVAEAKDATEQTVKRIQRVKEQQKRIKSELKEAQESPPIPNASEPRPALPRSSTEPILSQRHRGKAAIPRDTSLDEADPFEESAPSPAIQTRRTREKKRYSQEKLETPTSPISAKAHKRHSSGAFTLNRPSIAEERPSSADSIDIAVESYVLSPRLTQKVPHPRSGRMIAFSEVGDPKGHVVFCCLGMGLTRYLMAFYDELARTLKLRLVTLDRPGVGESDPSQEGEGTPLSWPDDVAIVCNHLKITKFSILAHSAGAIYALATALRIPQHVRGRIHLLAPWIPPSQMTNLGTHKEPLPNNAVPYSQRILRALPTPFLKVANSSFMNATSSSITTSLPKSPRRNKRKSFGKDTPAPAVSDLTSNGASNKKDAALAKELRTSNQISRVSTATHPALRDAEEAAVLAMQEKERQTEYDTRLTYRIWELATTNANPAVDLLVCLERRQTIGFRYVDINREVVIHHGSKDTRVPVDNVRWLGKTMRRCEVRVLEDEGHGLMASAIVMSNVLSEMAKEWEDWTTVVQGKRNRRTTITHHSSRSILAA
ncbi:hypothetical protein BGW36DRAFT_347313 [Talaromyces proteolyticus]|uniref:AB hydrolase-1 domain-containing protein n=1 Tax=Talaromyces proteolyticus TaxID=1131652 RepID=A0AAD4KLT5_9EURO|nr:uncharacterized protein BGW36DRAFT_347313 [Talaromyces proteolyticus]KAH8693072.1 hypothetical protein BGW36DRAFT_347313 [Talaromyces proteolyticus]